ncbi:hypothetical protein BV898_20022 [Hypsibius exemplaris]|nr:hypothetical protein BV898_20022 [Hypsibius exemplaris]
MSGFLAVGAQNCATTAEGQRVSKLCICKYDGCNAQTMGQLTDNSMFNGVPAASVSGLVMATSAGIMLLLGRALA